MARRRGTTTPQDLLLPEGKLIRTTRGGTSALKQLLLDLKKYSFSGYVRTVRTSGGERAEGIVLLRHGNPEASLYQRGPVQERGRAALKRVWQDSYDDAATIELHARVDMDGLVKEYADAAFDKPAKVVKKAKVPQTVDRSEVEARIREWRGRGYEAGSVESALGGDPVLLTASYLALREAVKKAEAVRETLDGLDTKGFEARAATLRERLRDPLTHPDIDAEVESLRDAIESHSRIEARRELEAARERDSHERAEKVIDLVLKQRTAVRPEGKVPTREELEKALERPAPTRDTATGLVGQFTFESFIVGESNRFAFSAAVAVAKEPHNGYNPLVIVSGPGLGKTHLLHSIGNRLRTRGQAAKLLYLSCESFASQLEDARKGGHLQAFRDRIRGVDCLLLDDVQFLSGKPECQEELFNAFNDLTAASRQIVMATDRPPKAIADLEDRLVSRLESGLVATIQAPELETRVAILRQRAADSRLHVDGDVLNLIAGLVEDNVRELDGALTRVVAFSSLMGRPITRELAKEVLREIVPTPPPARRAVSDAAAPASIPVSGAGPAPAHPSAVEVAPGRSYLVEEDRPEGVFQLLESTLKGGGDGLVITRTNPKRMRERPELRDGKVLWLTDRESESEETIAPALERIVYEIEDFLGKRPRGAVVLDGVEYLVSNNSFDAVLKFVRRLVDAISEGRHVLLISLGPATLKEQELRMLEREMEVVHLAGA